jgi:hypothetical protein
MGLPKAVMEQLDNIEEAIKKSENPPADDLGLTSNASSKPVEVPEIPVVDANQPLSPEPGKEDVAPIATILSRQETQPNDKQTGDWEHKYSVLQGMFRKQNEQNKQLVEQIKILEEEVESLNKASTKTTVHEQDQHIEVTDSDVRKYYSNEDIEEMGMDWCKKNILRMLRIQRENTPVPQKDPDIESIKSELAEKKTSDFYAELVRLVPDWKQINSTKAWTDFLLGILPEVGVTYMAVLDDATSRYDAKRVALLFDRFKESKKKVNPVAQIVPQAGTVVQKPSEGIMSFEQWDKEVRALPGQYKGEAFTEQVKHYDNLYATGKVMLDSPNQAQQGFI